VTVEYVTSDETSPSTPDESTTRRRRPSTMAPQGGPAVSRHSGVRSQYWRIGSKMQKCAFHEDRVEACGRASCHRPPPQQQQLVGPRTPIACCKCDWKHSGIAAAVKTSRTLCRLESSIITSTQQPPAWWSVPAFRHFSFGPFGNFSTGFGWISSPSSRQIAY
jgi:hypothetical protein